MSERITVEQAREVYDESAARERSCFDEHGGDCWPPCNRSAEEAFDRLKQAILDEGLKEYQALVDGLVKAGRAWLDCPLSAPGDWAQRLAFSNALAALAAVRKSQVSEGGAVEMADLTELLDQLLALADGRRDRAAVNLLRPMVEALRAAEAWRYADKAYVAANGDLVLANALSRAESDLIRTLAALRDSAAALELEDARG